MTSGVRLLGYLKLVEPSRCSQLGLSRLREIVNVKDLEGTARETGALLSLSLATLAESRVALRDVVAPFIFSFSTKSHKTNHPFS